MFDQWLSGSLHDNRVDLMLVEHSIYLLSHAPMKFISLYIEKVFGLQPSVDVSQIVIRTRGNLATRGETQICLDERRTLLVPLNSVVLLFERGFKL